jgi:hypothetical protein
MSNYNKRITSRSCGGSATNGQLRRSITMKPGRIILTAAAIAIFAAAPATAEVESPLFSSGGAVFADGTILAMGEFAIGPTGSGASQVEQGAVPCWTRTTCPGDLDGNGDVSLADLAVLLSNYGTASGATPDQGDIDGDGDVDLADLAVLLSSFGTTCN